MTEAIPDGPPPAILVGNLSDLIGGVHVGFPRLVQKYNEPAFFSFQLPSNHAPVPMDHFGGKTYILAEPDLLQEMFNRPDDFNKKLFKHSMIGGLGRVAL